MPQPDGCAPEASCWSGFMLSMDARLSDAINRYECTTGICGADMARAFNELHKLGRSPFAGSGDPDYDPPAMPVVYSLTYGPQRTTTLVLALDRLVRIADIRPLSAVLDLGSGTDAAVFALEATGMLTSRNQVICMDPSASMLKFSAMIQTGISRQHWNGTIETFSNSDGAINRLDWVLLSYAFQYHHAYAHDRFFARLVSRIADVLRPGGFVLYCGPNAKDKIADRLREHLVASSRMCCPIAIPGSDRPQLMMNHHMPKLSAMRQARIQTALQQGLAQYAIDKVVFNGQPSKLFTRHWPDQTMFASIRR